MWDSSALTKYWWIDSLHKYLPKTDSSYETIWEFGVVIEKGTTYVCSTEHALHLYLSNVRAGTFRLPSPPGGFFLIDATVDLSGYIAPPPPAVAGAPPVIAPNPPILLLPAFLEKRYRVNPELIQQRRREMLNVILSTIKNDRRAENYRGRSQGCGVNLLTILMTEISQIAPTTAGALELQATDLLARGLSAATQDAFDEFQDAYEMMNNALRACGRHVSDSILANRYADSVRRLGDKMEMRIDSLLTSKAADGDLVATLTCIYQVFEELEARGAAGRVFFAGGAPDPNKNGKGGGGAGGARKRGYDKNGKK